MSEQFRPNYDNEEEQALRETIARLNFEGLIDFQQQYESAYQQVVQESEEAAVAVTNAREQLQVVERYEREVHEDLRQAKQSLDIVAAALADRRAFEERRRARAEGARVAHLLTQSHQVLSQPSFNDDTEYVDQEEVRQQAARSLHEASNIQHRRVNLADAASTMAAEDDDVDVLPPPPRLANAYSTKHRPHTRLAEAVRPTRRKAAVGGLIALAGVGVFVGTGGGEEERDGEYSVSEIANDVALGEGFDENGMSETSYVAAELNLQPDAMFHFGNKKDSEDPLVAMLPFTSEGTLDVDNPGADKSHANMIIDNAKLYADVVWDADAEPITIEEPTEKGKDGKIIVDRSALRPQISVMAQEDGFYDLQLTDDDYKMHAESKKYLQDIADDDSAEGFTTAAINTFIENVEDKAQQEQFAYEALSHAAKSVFADSEVGEYEIGNGEVAEKLAGVRGTIQETLTAIADDEVKKQLKKVDLPFDYKVEFKGELQKPEIKGAATNVEDGVDLGRAAQGQDGPLPIDEALDFGDVKAYGLDEVKR